MIQVTLTGMGIVLMASALAALGCVGGETEAGSEADDLFERSCPHQQLDALLECAEPGYGELRFREHVGRFVLAERTVEEDLVGSQELSCRYALDPETPWHSDYELDGEAVRVSSLDELRALVDRIPDLSSDELAYVRDGLDEPSATLRYELGFWGRGALSYEGLGTGLEGFSPSASEDNPRAAKTSFIIDETAYYAGFGGTYATGLSCRLSLHAD